MKMLDSESRIQRSISLLSAIKLMRQSSKCLEYATRVNDDAVASVAEGILDDS